MTVCKGCGCLHNEYKCEYCGTMIQYTSLPIVHMTKDEYTRYTHSIKGRELEMCPVFVDKAYPESIGWKIKLMSKILDRKWLPTN